MLWEKLPPGSPLRRYGHEVLYGFKQTWRVVVTNLYLVDSAFRIADIISVELNGAPSTEAQMRYLYDYSKDLCSLEQPPTVAGSDGIGILVSLTSYNRETLTYEYDSIVNQEHNITGIVSVTGDMVNNSDPLRPVVGHDVQKLNVAQYQTDQAALNVRLQADELKINDNTGAITDLQSGRLTGVTFNGAAASVNNNVAAITADITSSAQLASGLAGKVDKNVAGAGNRIVQAVNDSFDAETRALTIAENLVSLEDGSTSTKSNTYNLGALLGIDALEGIDREHFYFIDASAYTPSAGPISISVAELYRYNDDGTKFVPASTEGVQLVISLEPNNSSIGVLDSRRIAGFGFVQSRTASELTVDFTRNGHVMPYNPYNGYPRDTLVYDSATEALFATIQAVPAPLSEAGIIPLTNEMYYVPVKDYTVMPVGTVWANFEAAPGPGDFYDVDTVRLALLSRGSGYDEYVEFTASSPPVSISTEEEWESSVSLWVTDGKQFTSLASLLTYLANFDGEEFRYKPSNLGIVKTKYDAGALTITPVFTRDTIKTHYDTVYQPIPAEFTTGGIPVYNDAGILTDSAVALSDLATAAQGRLADSAVQNVTLAQGSASGQLTLSVDGSDQNVSVPGLGSAAFQPASAFATAAQGALAGTAIQSATLAPGVTPGALRLTVDGVQQSETIVAGLGTAAFTGSNQYATAAQGARANSALQPEDVVDNLSSSDPIAPLSANQGRVLSAKIEAFKPSGKPIGGFGTYAEIYANTSQYSPDLLPINVGDTIYVRADETHTGQPAEYRVSNVDDATGAITYSFVRIVPDALRDFITEPIRAIEIADGAITGDKIQNGTIVTQDYANASVTSEKLAPDIQTQLTHLTSAVTSIAVAGEGNAIIGASQSGNTLALTRGQVSPQISVAGQGNVITDITHSDALITATRGNAIRTIEKSGTGNGVADLSVSLDGTSMNVATDTFFNTLKVEGSGNGIANVVAQGSSITVVKGDVGTPVTPASTIAMGIVMLNDTLTSVATDQALTPNQGRILNEKINANDALYVKLAGNQTITGTKTLTNHLVVPGKTALPVNASATLYATEAQTFTRAAKPTTATVGNVAIWDADQNPVDGGVSLASLQDSAITNNEIDAIVNDIFAA